MRLITLLFLGCLCTFAHADDQKPAAATAPPPPQLDPNEPVEEPQVTITKQTDQTIEEYRYGGKLYMIKVTPKVGPPYYLVDDQGDGKFLRLDGTDTGVRPPRWVIHRF